MTATNPTDPIITQGRTLVWAIEALRTIELDDPFEQALAELFREAYQRCLQAIVAQVPTWVGEEILSTGAQTRDGQVPEWLAAIAEPADVAGPDGGGNGHHPSSAGPALAEGSRSTDIPKVPI